MAMKVMDGLKIWIDDDELVLIRVRDLSKKPVSELNAIKDYWLREYKNSKKLDDLSIKRRREASHWLAAIDQLISLQSGALKIKGNPENMDVSEAATYLCISESKLYKMTSAREIPHTKIGKQLRFEKNKLDKFLENESVRTAEKSTREQADAYVANYPLQKKKRRNTH